MRKLLKKIVSHSKDVWSKKDPIHAYRCGNCHSSQFMHWTLAIVPYNFHWISHFCVPFIDSFRMLFCDVILVISWHLGSVDGQTIQYFDVFTSILNEITLHLVGLAPYRLKKQLSIFLKARNIKPECESCRKWKELRSSSMIMAKRAEKKTSTTTTQTNWIYEAVASKKIPNKWLVLFCK